jgi:hypothetical protein
MMPTLEELDEIGLRLYRDPLLRLPMKDALEDLGVSWDQWLERGTLERLAECVVSTQGGRYDQNRFYRLKDWIELVGGGIWNYRDSKYWAAICAAFGVPPVMIEVGYEHPIYGEPEFLDPTWEAPSVSLAMDVLRITLRYPDAVKVFGAKSYKGAVLEHHPNATAYRVRVRVGGDGDWHERQV